MQNKDKTKKRVLENQRKKKQ